MVGPVIGEARGNLSEVREVWLSIQKGMEGSEPDFTSGSPWYVSHGRGTEIIPKQAHTRLAQESAAEKAREAPAEPSPREIDLSIR